jgi:hypothetical protein
MQGMRELLVRDREDNPVVYLVCEPATRYHRVMTRTAWLPVLIGEVL